jgi:hypothetical protein
MLIFEQCRNYYPPKPYTYLFLGDFYAVIPVKTLSITAIIIPPILCGGGYLQTNLKKHKLN